MDSLKDVNWKRIAVVCFISMVWIELVVVAVRAWPNDSILNYRFMYFPTSISGAAVVFIVSLMVGFYYASYTHNYLFLACVIWGIIGFWTTFGLKTRNIFPDLENDPGKVFLALYAAAFMSRLTINFFLPNSSEE